MCEKGVGAYGLKEGCEGQQQKGTVDGLFLVLVNLHCCLFDDTSQQEDEGDDNGCLQDLW